MTDSRQVGSERLIRIHWDIARGDRLCTDTSAGKPLPALHEHWHHAPASRDAVSPQLALTAQIEAVSTRLVLTAQVLRFRRFAEIDLTNR
jgi:hypothetical protein